MLRMCVGRLAVFLAWSRQPFRLSYYGWSIRKNWSVFRLTFEATRHG